MNFKEGIKHIKDLVDELEDGEKSSFEFGELTIDYPGRKDKADYRVSINGVAPTHEDMMRELHALTTQENYKAIIEFLDDVYTNGLDATSTALPKKYVEKLYWLTLQEDINYPPPSMGRKLPFQRYYEGVISKLPNGLNVDMVARRTNNHGMGRPPLYPIESYPLPSFYN